MDKSRNRTELAIRKKVLELAGGGSLESIRVTDVCKALGIGRSTFYQYYDSTYDVIQQIEDDFFEGWEPYNKVILSFPFDDRYFYEPHPGFVASYDFLRQNDEVIRALLISKSEPLFAEKLLRHQKKVFLGNAIAKGYISEEEPSRTFYLDFVHGGIFSLARDFALLGGKISSEEAALLSYRLMFAPFRIDKMRGTRSANNIG